MKKRFCAAIAAVMMLGTILAMPASAAETYQKGDVNMDGKIDVEDAQLVLQAYVEYFTGNSCILNDDQIALANITGTTTMNPDTKEEVLFSGSDARIILVYWTFRDVTHEIEPDISIDDFYKDFSNFYLSHIQ